MTPVHIGSRRRSRARRGTALLAALVTIALLASVTAMASRAARDSAAIAVNSRAQAVARAMAESGVLAARVGLEEALTGAGADSTALDAVFDALTREARSATPRAFAADSLGDGVYAATIVNVSARLDVNTAGAEGLARLFRTVAPAGAADRIAARLAARVRGDAVSRPARDSAAVRDSLAAALLGRPTSPRLMRPFASLDEVETLLGADAPWLGRVAEELTVDGDGRIDRRHASSAVLAAASGSLVDRPTRLLVVARGWQAGHPLTREIQAVYAVEGTELRLVRWRERDR
ncbi:MAG: hypothetical protein ACK50C_09265 [Gemmatimonadaceae bacterium]